MHLSAAKSTFQGTLAHVHDSYDCRPNCFLEDFVSHSVQVWSYTHWVPRWHRESGQSGAVWQQENLDF